ncbi:hypothetical protein NXW38_07745 [Bacteroides ovatus]|nr:hypothetical protein [Bacteroides ovatus]
MDGSFPEYLKAGDKVILLAIGRVFFNLINRKDIKLYHERTEHPDIYKIKGFDVEKYKKHIKDLEGMFVISTTSRIISPLWGY